MMRRSALAALIVTAGTSLALGGTERVILQVFELEWSNVERRTPDIFKAGYRAVWLPPSSKASDAFSVGYDVFDRFDLGQPPLIDNSSSRRRTAYGTEATFRAMVEQLRRADIHVFVDAVLNHNSGRTTSDAFLAAGGWPGFWIPRENPPRNKLPTDDWGDFHGGNAQGFRQSENPGGSNYDLYRGDLVALIDIQQDRSNMFIRQPVAGGNPQNIPTGTVRNLPDAGNARFYPDISIPPEIFVNPPSNHSGSQIEFRHPFNLADPMQGDAIAEDSTGYLRRWLQWMLEVQRVDGFRIDALKHTFPWWWDQHFDSAVFRGRTAPDGSKVTPLSFGESTTGNFDMLNNYYRKDAFANRDTLDLNGAARLRELVNGNGFGSWANIFANADSGHFDQADDGLQNGSGGIFHIFSHDNGSVGTGGSMPPLPTRRQQGWYAHAYMLMRPGMPIVYHHARGIPRNSGFFPREGVPVALGLDPSTNQPEDAITRLVELHNTIATGFYFQRNGNISDVLVFERATNTGSGLSGDVLVGVSDRHDSGFDVVAVTTTFPQGTRLIEQTGNAANPAVDPGGQIPEVITVGANGAVSITVPRNVSSAGEHNRGYVVYSPAVPQATLSIVGQSGVIPPDPGTVPSFVRRLSTIPIVTADSFTIRLDTAPGDTVDTTTDDNALFRINAGAEDWNGSGGPDFPLDNELIGGYEQFTDFNQSGMSTPNRQGRYEQVIDATRLEEGFHYISVIAFRQRPAGSGPLFTEKREVVYIDRLPPVVELIDASAPFPIDRPSFRYRTPDRTVDRLHTFLNLPPGTDPVPLVSTLNAARPHDREELRRTFDEAMVPGSNTITAVAIEHSGRTEVFEFKVHYLTNCPADIAPPFGVLDLADINAFITAFIAQQPPADFAPPFGVFDLADINAFIAAFGAGCP